MNKNYQEQILETISQLNNFLIDTSFLIAKNFSIEPVDDGSNNLSTHKYNIMKSTISNVINKYFYSEEFDILDFVVNTFWNVLIGHKLSNGNKRFATAILVVFLYILYIDHNQIIFNEVFTNKICEFICNFDQHQTSEIDTNKNKELVSHQIKNWILSLTINTQLNQSDIYNRLLNVFNNQTIYQQNIINYIKSDNGKNIIITIKELGTM